MELTSKEDSESNPDDLHYIRTEDEICLSSTTHSLFQAKSYLVKRFGHNLCYVERETQTDEEPSNLWKYRFKIEEAISVHAIHGWKQNEKMGTRKMLLYGQAIMLSAFGKILRCFSYDNKSKVADKEKHMNYQIGYVPRGKIEKIDTTCWFTILPAAKGQSGERVKAGDDVYLVNVATKRYLSILLKSDVIGTSGSMEENYEADKAVATFTPWSWSMNIMSSFKDKDKFIGYLNGGEVIQIKLLHSKDEYLSVPLARSSVNLFKNSQGRTKVCFEDKSVSMELRSLWGVELFQVNFGGAFVQWGQPFRLLHISSGKYLGIEGDNIMLLEPEDADREKSGFCFVKKSTPRRHVFIESEPGMGKPTIKFGESEMLLFHFSSGTWIGQEMVGRSMRHRRGMISSGPSSVFVHHQPPQNTSLAINTKYEIALSAVIAKEMDLNIKELAAAMKHNDEWKSVHANVLEKSLLCFQEILNFLKLPSRETLSAHDYQKEKMYLRNRQTRLNHHGSVKLVFGLLKCTSEHYSLHPSHTSLEIQQHLCKILAALVKDNQNVCKEFASEKSLDTLVGLLNQPCLTDAMLEFFHCLLEKSPEVLCALTEKHIMSFVNLLYVNGRDYKIMQLLRSLCLCQGIAMRDKQQHVCRHLMKSKDLLLHTSLHSKVHCFYANIFLDAGEKEGKWYYEFHWKVKPSSMKPHVRVGCASFQFFRPYPTSSCYQASEGGIGDDFSSIGFDGKCIWLGGEQFSPTTAATSSSNDSGSLSMRRIGRQQSIQSGYETNSKKKSDNSDTHCVGCCYDSITKMFFFTLNGREMPLRIRFCDFETENIPLGQVFIVPAVSVSGGLERAEFRFGGDHGELFYKPPEEFSPLYAHEIGKEIHIWPFIDIGDMSKGILKGPQIIAGQVPFIPSVIDTSQIEVIDSIHQLIDKMAVEMHESWSYHMIIDGWSYGSSTNSNTKTNSNLRPYEELPPEDRWSLFKAKTIILTLLALGCTISESTSTVKNELKFETLNPTKYKTTNNFSPRHLVTSNDLPRSLWNLTEKLAENSHNAWAEKKLEEGWTYGLKNNYEGKRLKNLIPFHSLPTADRENYRDIILRILRLLIALGYNVQPPVFDLSQTMDDSFAQIPFRTFRGQFASYCTGHGKWYFSVKIIRGQMMKVGWATKGFSSSTILGSDATSYAIDGFQAYKWHDGRHEKFGQKWREGDTITCLLDLDQQTMSFGLEDSLLCSPSGETVAFQGIPKNEYYVPAVTLFLSEKVELNLGKLEDDKATITAGYEGIGTNIKCQIPLWFSDNIPVFEPISQTHPYCSTKHSTNSISVTTNSTGRKMCLKLNMGIPILSSSISSSSSKFQEGTVSWSISFPVTQDTQKVFLGWSLPDMLYNEDSWNETIPDTYKVCNVDILTPNEKGGKEDAWKVSTEYSTGFIVRLSALLGHKAPSVPSGEPQIVRADCTIDVETGEMTFVCSGYQSHTITMQTSVSTKLFPLVITTPSQEDVCEFMFKPINECLSIRAMILDGHYEEDVHLVPSMKILCCSNSTWRQMDDYCIADTQLKQLKTSDSACMLPDVPQKQLMYITLPMEERVLGFAELFEFQDLTNFHLETLKTFRACCMHDNSDTGKEVRKHFIWEKLFFCIKYTRWDYNIRAAYFDLLNTLHLEHVVNSRLLVQNDHIFAIESYQNLEPDSRRNSFSHPILNNEISAQTATRQCTLQLFPANDLKSLIFSVLERLMKTEVFTCRMLSSADAVCLLHPLLTALDSLVVLHLINEGEEMERLLALLHPSFAPEQGLKAHQTLLTLVTDESIRLVLCNLLEHLCDTQIQSRLEHIIKFADHYVGQLQEDQRKRVEDAELSSPVLQEVNTPTEKQVEAILSFMNDESSTCPTNEDLRETLMHFHSQVIAHCGVPETHVSAKEQLEKEPSLMAKLKELVKLATKSNCLNARIRQKHKSKVTQLQEVITTTLIGWAREGIKDVKLTEKLFLLLHRQFNETEELIKALSHTYVVEKVSEFCSDGILEFRTALGNVRGLLSLGMGEEEEKILEKMLRTLQQSELFSKHPDLLRLTGVHITVMNVVKSYLSFNTVLKGKHNMIRIRLERKRKMALSETGFAGPVEECCKFLCAFASTSRQNQLALFEHIPYMLDKCSEHPDHLSNESCSPLDVAAAVIQNNLELALALSEDTFKKIMILMEKMTFSYGGGGSESDSDSPRSSKEGSSYSSMSMEWSPYGSFKCLKFLYAAVWVNGETVAQNASIIIKLLIQYPYSLGPGSLGQNLGIVSIFQESVSMLSSDGISTLGRLKHQETLVRFEREHRHHGTLSKKSSSLLNISAETADITLSFYTFLVRLLACCAPTNEHRSGAHIENGITPSNHVVPFLQSLISFDDVKTILSLPLSTYTINGITPKQKEVVLMFLDRIYGITDPKFLIYLIKDVFTRDLDASLCLCKGVRTKYDLVDFFQYLCSYVLPFLEHHSYHILSYSITEMSHIIHFIKLGHQVLKYMHVSNIHRRKVDSFVVSMTRTLPPQAFLLILPEISKDLNGGSSNFNTALKAVTAHFEQYCQYYSQGTSKTYSKVHPPGRQQKMFIALIFNKLLSAVPQRPTSNKSAIIQCLKALASSITPESLMPLLAQSSFLLERVGNRVCRHSSCTGFSSEESSDNGSDSDVQDSGHEHSNRQSPESDGDDSCLFNGKRVEVTLPPEVVDGIQSFAEHCHDHWVYMKQQLQYWTYGPQYSAEDQKDPNLRPFSKLDREHQLTVIRPIEKCVKELLLWGYIFTRRTPFKKESLPMKLQMLCIVRPRRRDSSKLLSQEDDYRNFIPSVVDLEKLDCSYLKHFQVIAESTAIVANDLLHVCSTGDPCSLDSPEYNPFPTLYNGEGYIETCHFIEDMLKYFHVKGLLCCGAFNALPGHVRRSANSNCVEHAPFGQQLFDNFLSSINVQCRGRNCLCWSNHELFYPIITHYLERHTSYFNPLMESMGRSPTYASREEKILIAKLLSHFHQFLRHHLNNIIKTPSTETSGGSYRPPKLSAIREFNDFELQQLNSLSLALLKAFDINEEEVISEIERFFKLIAGALEDFPIVVEKEFFKQSNLSDQKFLLYCLHCLVPMLCTLFQQLCKSSNSHNHLKVISTHSLNIFNCLFHPAEKFTQVFTESATLTKIGSCLAALCRLHLADDCHLPQMAKFELSYEEMFSDLKWAAAKRLTTLKIAFVGSVVVPVLASSLHLSESNNERDIERFAKLSLRLAHEYLGEESASWMLTLCESVGFHIGSCPRLIFSTHILPLISSLSEYANAHWQTEQLIFASMSIKENDLLQKQRQHRKNLAVFCRDVSAVMFVVTKFLSSRESNIEKLVGSRSEHNLAVHMSKILDYYYSSQRFARKLDSCTKITVVPSNDPRSSYNALLLCVDVLLQSLPPPHQKMVNEFQSLFTEKGKSAVDIENTISQSLTVSPLFKGHVAQVFEEIEDDEEELQRRRKEFQGAAHILRILSYTKYYLHQLQKSQSPSVHGRWKTLMTRQRRDSVLRCLKAVPFHRLKRHRAVNLFLYEYSRTWLSKSKECNMERLCERLLDQEDYEAGITRKVSVVSRQDPLSLLFSMFTTIATTQQWEYVNGPLYEAYLIAVVKTTEWVLEENEEKERESVAEAYERFHKRLALASTKQDQLLRRGVTSMILSVLAACEGQMNPLVHITIKLGIVLLEGGNNTVQKALLKQLGSMDADVFMSIKELVSSCGVLNWTSYERNFNSGSHDNNIGAKVFPSSNQVIDLFRFLQLLCEGHNDEFQNFLRTQERNSTSVNIVIATVDYLLKLQESVRDFYWHHAHYESLELPARESFLVSFHVTRQVFRTLTEFIQGPCVGNQQALSQSRLWDAVSGYLHIFTSLQQKLFRHTSHIELLREVLNLQEEFFILLLSMLEGSMMSSSIGHHMIGMFLESENHVVSLIMFYNIFIKLSDATTAKAFKEYDLNKDGFISYREFEKAMQLQQHYSKDEIDYLMQLADTNKDGLLDYKEFTDRFHHPANNLGFHLCALIQQLSDILPNDQRVCKFRELAKDLFQHFKENMGCVEIMGKSQRIERVYFRIKNSRAKQWEDPAIRESRNDFVHSLEITSQREKLDGFVNFCENTIFEINYNDALTGVELEEKLRTAERHRKAHYSLAEAINSRSVLSQYQTEIAFLRATNPKHPVFKFQSLLTFLWINILFSIIIKPVLKLAHFIGLQVAFLWHNGEGPLRIRSLHSLSKQILFFHYNATKYFPRIVYSFGSLESVLANSYFKIKYLLMLTTLLINMLILVTIEGRTYWSESSVEEEENKQQQDLREILGWLIHTHFILSFIIILCFWNQKIQLILLKEEKKIGRKLEAFNGNISLSLIDCLVVKSPSFPRYYWDKQVKERVLNRTPPDQKEYVCNFLGMEASCKFDQFVRTEQLMRLLSSIIDVRYHIWKLIVVAKQLQVLYHFTYCLLSFAGIYWNIFYFSIHLLDFMLQSKTLVTVLRSLKINIKQLVMTLGMTCVVLYIYAVIGFNFFRKFYRYELQGGEVLDNCNSMWNCFFFHLDKGLRSGGGIADVLVSAIGDQQYMLRLSFDMTFFFIVIVILLAIFQGLIIDAFGELRKKEDIITDELKKKCFICGIGKNDFSSPHEFDDHINYHHSMRDYMFFMMHLIGKPETEFTGQESYVWEHYVQQRWDFFPSGTCFQLQEKQRLLAKANEHQQQLHIEEAKMNSISRRHHPSLYHSKTVATVN